MLILAVVAAAMLFLLRERRISGDWGFPLDDSWIHATIARNFALGRGFQFNPGDHVAGSTAPLYTLLLAALYFLSRESIWCAKLLGVLCQCGSAVAIYYAVRALEPKRNGAALLAGILVAISPPLLWSALSGMEISLYTLLVCAGIYCYATNRMVAATLFWAIGVWVRPDGLWLLALSLAVLPGRRVRRVILAGSIVIAFLGFNQWVGSTWLPQTVGIKAHLGFEPLARTWNLLREWGALWGMPYRHDDALEHPIALLLLLLIGAAVTLRGRPIFALYAIGFPLVLSLFRDNSGSHKRYLLSVIPFGMILAAQGLEYLASRLRDGRAARAVAVAGVACFLWQARYAVGASETYGWNVQNVNKMQRLLGTFARIATLPGDRVATNDIGAIGYWSERYIVDLVGLVTPPRPLPVQLTLYKPALLIVFVDWFKDYARWDPADQSWVFFDSDSTHKYMLVAGIELSRNTICSRDQMLALERLDRDAPAPRTKLLKRF